MKNYESREGLVDVKPIWACQLRWSKSGSCPSTGAGRWALFSGVGWNPSQQPDEERWSEARGSGVLGPGAECLGRDSKPSILQSAGCSLGRQSPQRERSSLPSRGAGVGGASWRSWRSILKFSLLSACSNTGKEPFILNSHQQLHSQTIYICF